MIFYIFTQDFPDILLEMCGFQIIIIIIKVANK